MNFYGDNNIQSVIKYIQTTIFSKIFFLNQCWYVYKLHQDYASKQITDTTTLILNEDLREKFNKLCFIKCKTFSINTFNVNAYFFYTLWKHWFFMLSEGIKKTSAMKCVKRRLLCVDKFWSVNLECGKSYIIV